MPKEYFCNKLLQDGSSCQERNPLKFEKGRYSACKSCRTALSVVCHKSKNIEKKEEKIKKIDPDVSLRWLIEDILQTKPFMNGKTIIEAIESTDTEISFKISSDGDKEALNNKKFELQEIYNERLGNSILKLREENLKLNDEIEKIKQENFILKNKTETFFEEIMEIKKSLKL